VTESGVPYQEGFGPKFAKSYRRYKSLHRRIDQIMSRVLDDPYLKSERLGKMPGGLDLRGCRSVRITQSFRLIFAVCEECRRVPECRYCFCEGWPDRTVIFLTVGPHERAYAMREVPIAYVTAEQV
jgi:mRNA-degrading endonuclease RelE of RelBE toxin-antitoxin system